MGDHAEPGDGALTALVVAVEHVDGERLSVHDVLAQRDVVGVVGVTQRALPEAQIAGGDVEVPRLHPELLGVGVRGVGQDQLRADAPSEDHGEPRTDVADGDGEVDAAVDLVDVGPVPLEPGPMVVHPANLLGRIIEARRDQDGAEADLERGLGDTSRPVRRAHGGERRAGKHERSDGRGERRGGGPVLGRHPSQVMAPATGLTDCWR